MIKSPPKDGGLKKYILPGIVILLLQVLVGYAILRIVVGDCSGVGLGGYYCTGNGSLWPIGLLAFVAIPIIAGWLFSAAIHKSLSWKETAITFCVVMVFLIPGALIVSSKVQSYRDNRANADALLGLKNDVQNFGFTFYVPTYLPTGFHLGQLMPGDSPYISFEPNDYSNPSKSFLISEDKVSPYFNPPQNCYNSGPNTASTQSCHLFAKDSSGEQIYIDTTRGDLGDVYFLNHIGTFISINNGPSIPQNQILQIFNSLLPRTTQQLQELL